MAGKGWTYNKKLTTAPASEPVTTAEMKTYLYVDHSDHDTMIGNLIKAARQKVEVDYDVALIDQTYEFYLDGFPVKDARYNPAAAIEPSIYPVSSITSIAYTDNDGNGQTWDGSNYTLNQNDNRPHRIVPAYGVSYPATRDITNAITITLVAGYGSSSSDVPEPVRLAIQMMVKLWYDNPEDMRLAGMPWHRSARALLNNFFEWRM